MNGSNPRHLEATCGVSQGSTLDSLPFLISINNPPNSSSTLSSYPFTDDTNISNEADSLDVMQSTVNKEPVIVNGGAEAKDIEGAIYNFPSFKGAGQNQ